MKRLIWLIGCAICLSGTVANACSGQLAPGCVNCEWSAAMTARRGQPCGMNSISLAAVSVTGGAVIEKPKIGKAAVKQGPGFTYIGERTGTDTFVIGFRGVDRFNSPYTVKIRVNVTVTE